MDRPRLLLIPNLTEIEWVNRASLEEWADVASYDAPGVGDEPPVDDFGSQAIGRRGIEEMDRRGWQSCVVVADEFGVAAAVHIAATAPERLQALALGHARLSNAVDGPGAPINREVHSACRSLIQNDLGSFIRQMFKMTGGERMQGGYGEEIVEAYRRRVPRELLLPFWDERPHEGDHIGDVLSRLDAPVFLAHHKGCLLFTDEGFKDVVAAQPDAHAASFDEKPSTSAEFAGALQSFCAEAVTLST
jgi:hypothetical protein